ncbi:uncharacterized protein LOC100476990 isoform X1 [Ailuropoda melanoleuca]|uniref:uncharacterized protein LOC100476990 isoform X1 n=1 Tax=Ailuropoda melanoleuca TaxID=9646 RepID=UPI0014943136|nr:uncharacterized protein LOC100476990 isoform X1 [Ailuropoda melanoleuca]XP_034526402.1 uncharacterized protein LOC100476990 isoform X1 [Ailuropoda melanoleuca]
MPSPRFVFSSLHSGRGPQRHCSSHDLVRLYPEASILFPLQTAPPCNSPLGVSGTPQVFYRTAKESEGTCCPVLRSSLRGALCLGDVEPWEPQLEPSPSAQYDLSGTRAALLLSVVHDRPGAQHDVEALGGLCQALSFKTTLRTDPTAQAFQEEMAQFRECLDALRDPVSCALVALMAHGGPQGQLLGADGQEVQPEALVQELSHCRALWGCPKIFLLQACRGGQRDAGVGPTALPWFRRWLQASPTTPSHADVLQIYADAQGSSSAGPASGSPDQADVLMVYAAAEGKGTGHRESLLHRALHPGWISGVTLGEPGLGRWGKGTPAQLQLIHPPSIFTIYKNSNDGGLTLRADCAECCKFLEGSASGPCSVPGTV